MSLASLRLRAVVPIMVFAGLGAPACTSANPNVAIEGEPDLGDQSEAVDYFCVDHPCADLHPFKPFGECFRPFGRYSPVMRIWIENIGAVGSGASKAQFSVDYYKYSRSYDVPSIAAKGYTSIDVTLPSQCMPDAGPGCSWRILADSLNWVRETNDDNNSMMGACIY